MRLIRKHDLAGFFLIHHDLLELAREVAVEVRGVDTPRAASHLPPGRGRGSSVSSIVCYLIGLSPIDPVGYKLSFGRFLNEEIRSVPDIDLDFPRDIRERADRPDLRDLRQPGGPGLRLRHLPAPLRRARCRQGAGHPGDRPGPDLEAQRAGIGHEARPGAGADPRLRRPQGRPALVAT